VAGWRCTKGKKAEAEAYGLSNASSHCLLPGFPFFALAVFTHLKHLKLLTEENPLPPTCLDADREAGNGRGCAWVRRWPVGESVKVCFVGSNLQLHLPPVLGEFCHCRRSKPKGVALAEVEAGLRPSFEPLSGVLGDVVKGK
jgi:hypothetical protein